jgi:threonylcarbamoyladenosine tRNA methylthiotransferase CDKAL1
MTTTFEIEIPTSPSFHAQSETEKATKKEKKKQVWVEAYGCSASVADSEIIKGILLNGGYELAADSQASDLNLLVTCGVKESTEHKMLSRIREFGDAKKPIVVAGCLPKADRYLVEKFCPHASLLGPHSLDMTLSVVDSCMQGRKAVALTDSKHHKLNLPMLRVNPTVGIVQISSGCLSNCSFCQTKIAKGTLRSYRIGDIVRQVEGNVLDGCKEIWLTSTDNGCYGFDIKTDLVDLLTACSAIPGDFQIRVGMMNPVYVPFFMDRLITTYLENAKIFKFIHIPVQSGSDRILRKMKRGHTARMFSRIIASFRKLIPGITIATDLIAGFPSETEEDFQRTVALIKATEPDVVNSSRFSSRPGTVASRFPKVDLNEVMDRTKRLHGVIKTVSQRRNKFWKGWEGKIVIDEVNDKFIQGRNYAYKPVVMEKKSIDQKLKKSQFLGAILRVKVIEISNFSLKGSILS